MIKRIVQIRNVGRFYDCRLPGLEFQKETLIYGKNAQGKSTLVSIFKSLKTGDNKILIGRKTFGSNTDQKIEIHFEDNSVNDAYIFPSAKWDGGYPKILMFDNSFISENIFEGDKISFDQQKKLNRIIIGEEGIRLNREINDLQVRLDEISNRKREITRDFQKLFPVKDHPGVTVEKFCDMIEDAQVSSKIDTLKRKIELAQNKDAVLSTLRKHVSILRALSLNSIKEKLSRSFKSDPSKIEEHIEKNWNDTKHTKNFLKEGLDLTKKEKQNCVFCGQRLEPDALELLNLYEQFFKGEYEKLILEINIVFEKISQWNPEAFLASLKAELEKNKIALNLTAEEQIDFVNTKVQMLDEIVKKQKDLNYTPDFSSFIRANELFEKVEQELTHIQTINFPESDEVKTVLQLQGELKNLELTNLRGRDDLKIFCGELSRLNTESELKREQRDTKREQLQDYSMRVFNAHKSKINFFLSEMGADFLIGDFAPIKNLVGQKERIFAVQFFNQHKVRIDEENPALPNFKNTFSDSDKRLLAFAFFLSVLSNEKDLDNQVIVFDDPFSSFDEERKRKTIHLLADIRCKYRDQNGVEQTKLPLQRIILTHERNFFREIYLKEFPSAQTLKIEFDRDVSGVKSSKISYCDVSEDFPEDEIIAKIKRVKEIETSKSFGEKYSDDCRIILENVFKRKYLFELQTAINSRGSVRTFTQTLQSKYDGATFQKLLRLCTDLNIELHDSPANTSKGDHESILRDFFDCLELI